MTFERMFKIQEELHQKYGEKYGVNWSERTSENANIFLLYSLGEMGEVIDILKKQGHEKIMKDQQVREDCVKEIVDVFMYLTDFMASLNIYSEEISRVYEEKHSYNMKRW